MKIDPREYEFEEKVISINRVSKVVKGGKKFRYSVWVVVGNRAGIVGYGHGKADEVPAAIQKAIKDARGRLIRVPIVGTSIPYSLITKYKSAKVLIKPATPGTGIIANDKLRAIFELGGYKDVLTKCLGSNNPFNNIIAVYNALLRMRTPEEFAELRGKSIEEMLKGRRRIEVIKDASN
ncbi:MAG: 30S ribosomal protein S5 [candidate division WOR-3 bacterium]